ncbi:glycosyltransferase family 1 protein [Sedimentibacter sp.]|uniref:glycosyltransferase family 4 protein n=1 Tax=Sedimentibacter sp. TaxID=1960295 RepID=UPI0028A846AB|nr:glycosyltransferase family 1 protein [Sedimentibacter sp.]
MKIAIFSDTYSPQINGVTNTLDKLVQYFESNHIEYKIFAPKYDDENKEEHTERFYSLKFFMYPECRLALPNIFRISQSLSEFKPDIIHLMTEFNMGMTGMIYGKKNNIPTISNYTTNFSQYTEYYNLEIFKQPIWDYMKWFHNQNNITLCPSNEAQKLLNKNGINKTSLFSRGIDSHKFNPSYRNVKLRKELGIENKTTFLYVGRVATEKDMDILNESYRLIREKHHNTALIITGEGPYLEECKEMFPEDTIYTGFKKGHELAEIYASSDMFVCPSSTETFGNVVLEAMASGLAVIGADAGGIKEIISHKQNGLKFKAKDSNELTNCMQELIENKSLRNYVKSNGLKFAQNRTWERIIDNLYVIYCEILKENQYISA